MEALRRFYAGVQPVMEQIPVFVSAAERSELSGAANFYRIPGIARGRTMTHAFIEARHNSWVDHGEVSIAWSRLDRLGRAPSRETILIEDQGPWGDGVTRRQGNHNPTPVYDPVEGHLHLLFMRKRGDVSEGQEGFPDGDPAIASSMRAIVSEDGDGAVWRDRVGGASLAAPIRFDQGTPVDGRASNWRLFYPGPGHGICMPDGTLLAPGWAHDGQHRAIILRYDRQTRRWRVNGALPHGSSEASLAVASDGRLIVNARPATPGGRIVAVSSTMGADWDSVVQDNSLPDPSCFGSILSSARADRPRVVLFSNPANTTRRQDLEIKLSLDDHRTFPVARRLYPKLTNTVSRAWDGSAIPSTAVTHTTEYSDLVELDDDMFGLLLEQRVALRHGTPASYAVTTLLRFNLAWVLGGG